MSDTNANTKFTWAGENERKLMMLTLGRQLGAEDYEKIAACFPEVTLVAVKIRTSRLRVERTNLFKKLGLGEPDAGAAGKGRKVATKSAKGAKAAAPVDDPVAEKPKVAKATTPVAKKPKTAKAAATVAEKPKAATPRKRKASTEEDPELENINVTLKKGKTVHISEDSEEEDKTVHISEEQEDKEEAVLIKAEPKDDDE
ncbi:hypothetical protein BU16DRAFT_622083 [Lophium mytilinum]|uniref:Myb-like domain-containing protein n=1 Tax=Lophium mytilinum TaxID=390894 RepID=A0A6A6QDY0_9PEZI|nr:hypothetical protein BU16DRAFT_622083 [Lophium mytilinum]